MNILHPNYQVKLYSPSLIKNGNCEQGEASPTYWTSSGGDATSSTTDGEYYSGTRGFKVVGGSDYWASYMRECDAETEYTLRCYVKADSADLTLSIEYYNAYGIYSSNESIITYNGSRGWKEYIIKFTTPESVGLFEIKLANTSGTAYFDLLSVCLSYSEFSDTDIFRIDVNDAENRVKTANITLNNADGLYSDVSAGDYLEIWLGNGSNITKKFAGRLGSTPRSLTNSGANIQLIAKHGNNSFYRDKCNGETYVAYSFKEIIVDLVEKHFPDITVQNVQDDASSVNMEFTSRQSIQEAWDEIMERSGWVIFLDDNWDLHFEDSSLTESERVIEEGKNTVYYNIDYDEDQIINAMRVAYGADLDEAIEYESQESIDTHGRYKEVKDLDYLSTEEAALSYAQDIVEKNKDPPLCGKIRIKDSWMNELTTYMTVTLKVYNEAINTTYEIKSAVHHLDNNGMYTELQLNAIKKSTPITQADILKRLAALEEGGTTEPTTKNIYKEIKPYRIRGCTLEVWTQGTGSSSVYGKAKYGTAVYGPRSASTWFLHATVSG